jgi:hypothetical protein
VAAPAKSRAGSHLIRWGLTREVDYSGHGSVLDKFTSFPEDRREHAVPHWLLPQ